jgi:hypothetical protein
MQGPKTGPNTLKTAKTPEAMAKMGNMGNTHGTRLPNGGCPRGTKKSGKRRKGY